MITNPPALPRSWEGFALSAQALVGTAFTYALDVQYFLNTLIYQTTPANGNSFGWYANLEAGTYKVGIWHDKTTDRGIQDLTIGSIVVGTLDCYAAGLARNQIAVFTGIVIPTSGNYLVKSVVNGKNAASSNFYIHNPMWYITQ